MAASQAAAEASAAEEARLRALADEVAAVAEQQKRDLTARVDELQRVRLAHKIAVSAFQGDGRTQLLRKQSLLSRSWVLNM